MLGRVYRLFRQEGKMLLYKHLLDTGYDIDFVVIEILARVDHWNKRIVRGAIQIKKYSDNINRKDDAVRLQRATIIQNPVGKKSCPVRASESGKWDGVDVFASDFKQSQYPIVKFLAEPERRFRQKWPASYMWYMYFGMLKRKIVDAVTICIRHF